MNIQTSRLAMILKNYFRDLLGGIKKPGPYLLFDVATILANFFLFDLLTRNFRTIWLDSYFFIFIFFLLSIFLKAFDSTYLNGLHFIRCSGKSSLGSSVNLFVYLMSPVVGGFAIGSGLRVFKVQGVAPPEIGIPLFLTSIVAYPLLFFLCAERRAKNIQINKIKTGPVASFLIRSFSGFGIYMVSLYFLTFVYYNLHKLNIHSISWGLRPLVTITFIMLLFLVYMPARIHYFIDRPDDRGNRAWLIFTVISVSLFALTGRQIL